MGNDQKKLGFVDRFMAYNVNISSPDTNAKWNMLAEYVKQHGIDLNASYNGSQDVRDLIYFVQKSDAPDALFEFSKKLQSLIQKHRREVARDSTVCEIVKQLAEVAKSSYDKRVIDLASKLVGELVELRK